jgi:polysaccharide biosynthesis/export protein
MVNFISNTSSVKKKKNLFEKANYARIAILMSLFITSCSSDRNLVYFSDLPPSQNFDGPIKNYVQPTIQPDDIISITVSSLNPESNVLFNNVILPPTAPAASNNAAATRAGEGYQVDKSGFINFPVIGKIMLAGLTKEQAIEKMTSEIKVHVKNPIVNVRFMNFKVTVIGEVNAPATFVVATEKINVLEALGLAGDMTEFGRRENVLIIREQQGVRRTARVNLNNKDVLNSPFFYLQQNDIIYVEPDNHTKTAQTAPSNRYIGVWATAISTLAFVAIAVIYNE